MVRQAYFSSIILEPISYFQKKMCYFQRMFEVERKKENPNNTHITKMETYCRCSGFRKKYNLRLKKKSLYKLICCHNFVVFGAYSPFAESFKHLLCLLE